VRGLLQGKRVVLVDDSIVRGTTAQDRAPGGEAGATEVHMRISCPPTISPCYYGVDTPTREELIAAEIIATVRDSTRRNSNRLRANSIRANAPWKKSGVILERIHWATFHSKNLRRAWRIRAARTALPAYTGIYPVDGSQAELDSRAAGHEEPLVVEFRRCQMNGELEVQNPRNKKFRSKRSLSEADFGQAIVREVVSGCG